ncbi:MAG TPA: hypothetical protein P5110_10095 [Candidatus Omnitrophota bacterium]|nr:hypothetical protein [Candidatus Omnitrophota bacterium]HRZ15847.1 hypothetical protein [Candidatus Omnitrophota bacterium]
MNEFTRSIERTELAESRDNNLFKPANVKLQSFKLRYSHPYDSRFLRHLYDEVLKVIRAGGYRNLVFIGSGSGNEAAYIRAHYPACKKCVVTDLSEFELRLIPAVFRNYGAAQPDLVFSCSFNNLAFSPRARAFCAVAFLCLHHCNRIDALVSSLTETFENVIIVEPTTNPFLNFLARLNLARRAEGEGAGYRPDRLTRKSFAALPRSIQIRSKTFLWLPRDYMPFISHRQQVVFDHQKMGPEKYLGRFFAEAQLILNFFLRCLGFGNFMLVHLSHKPESKG